MGEPVPATKALKIGTSGIRGVFGETLTPEIAANFAAAFTTTLVEKGISKPRILVASDSPGFGEVLSMAVSSGIMYSGGVPVYLGLLPAPAAQVNAFLMGAAGGIIAVTAHNDVKWKALKFFREDGAFLNAAQMEELIDLYNLGEFNKATWKTISSEDTITDAWNRYAGYLKKFFRPFKRNFRILIDPVNSALSIYIGSLLEELNVDFMLINQDITSLPNRPPDPVEKNLGELISLASLSEFDISAAFDFDSDRVTFLDENGRFCGEDTTFLVLTEYLLKESEKGLSDKSKVVVANTSVSQAIEDIAIKHSARVERVRVGQAYIGDAVKNHSAIIGGEGNGSVVLPEISLAQDGIAAMLYILKMLEEAPEGTTFSEIVSTLPSYFMIKETFVVPFGVSYKLLEEMRRSFKRLPMVDISDGIKVFLGDKTWFHVRVSQTEQALRVIVESDDEERAGRVYSSIESLITEIKKRNKE